jgi:hypothetical protein
MRKKTGTTRFYRCAFCLMAKKKGGLVGSYKRRGATHDEAPPRQQAAENERRSDCQFASDNNTLI